MADKKLPIALAVVPIAESEKIGKCFYDQCMLVDNGIMKFSLSTIKDGETAEEAITRICRTDFGFENKNSFYGFPIVEDDRVVIPVMILIDERTTKIIWLNSSARFFNRDGINFYRETGEGLARKIDSAIYSRAYPIRGPGFKPFIEIYNRK